MMITSSSALPSPNGRAVNSFQSFCSPLRGSHSGRKTPIFRCFPSLLWRLSEWKGDDSIAADHTQTHAAAWRVLKFRRVPFNVRGGCSHVLVNSLHIKVSFNTVENQWQTETLNRQQGPLLRCIVGNVGSNGFDSSCKIKVLNDQNHY